MKPHPPRCESCGTAANVHYVPRAGTIPGTWPALRPLCGDCEYRETHDAVVELRREPTRRKAPPQLETLW